MKFVIDSDYIGYDLAQAALTDFAAFLNTHVLAARSQIALLLPPVVLGDNGIYGITISLEFHSQPDNLFLKKKSGTP